MQPTERTRTPEPVPPRPAERLMFTRRELLLTTWDQRTKMTPGEEVQFTYQRFLMQLQMWNAGQSVDAAAAREFQAVKDGVPDPEKPDATPVDLAPAPPRKRALVPA